MNIVHLSSSDTDGAFSASYRFHINLKKCGFVSKMVVKTKRTDDPDVSSVKVKLCKKYSFHSLQSAFHGALKQESEMNQKYCFYNRNEKKEHFSTSALIDNIPISPDVIMLHWVTGFVNARNIYELSQYYNVPVLWYVMDMAPFTGGCHYAWKCKKYQHYCGTCPALYSSKKIDLSYENLMEKLKYVSKIKSMTVVAPSSYIQKQAQASKVFASKNAYKMYISADDKIFRRNEQNKKILKKELTLPERKKIIFFGARFLSDPRKGFEVFIDSLKILKVLLDNRGINYPYIIIVGEKKESMLDVIPFPYKYVTLLADDRSLANIYQVADFYVCSSLEDTGPMMVNESIMCGTPVVSFPVGVASDLVIHNKTGYITSGFNTAELAKGMYELLTVTEKKYTSLVKNCLSMRKKHLIPTAQIRRFKEILNTL